MFISTEKEEHLLPLPYETNCSNNGPSEDAKESTHPNSFQVCQEMCRSEFAKAVRGCDRGMTMVSSISDLCYGYFKRPDVSSEQKTELEKKQLICKQNCKQGCLKLQYKYKITESTLSSSPGDENTTSAIDFYVKNPEVTVLRHVPVYSTIEIFSHIGGLLGCWLGISVFTFTDVIEKVFRKVVKWKRRFRKRRFGKRRFGKRIFRKRRFRKKKEQRAPTSEIHQD